MPVQGENWEPDNGPKIADRPPKYMVSIFILFASNATQLIKVNSTVTAVATLKVLGLNFFISLGFIV